MAKAKRKDPIHHTAQVPTKIVEASEPGDVHQGEAADTLAIGDEDVPAEVNSAGVFVDTSEGEIMVDGVNVRDLLVTDSVDAFAPVAVLTHVSLLTRPSREQHIRVHTDPQMSGQAYILRLRESGGDMDGTYIVDPKSGIVHAEELRGMIRPYLIHTAITRHGTVFLLAARIPGPDGRRDAWMDSMLNAVETAKSTWVRIYSAEGCYRAANAHVPIPEPRWPDTPFDRLLAMAVTGRIVSSPEHPAVLALLGRA